MEFKDIFTDLRKKAGLSQSETAEKLFVTRQAVSRWERGETVPGIETLQAISKLFSVSINTLLGYPTDLACQSCGMPITPEQMGRHKDGSLNEHYCKRCWDGGDFCAPDCTMEEMVEFCLPYMPFGDPESNRAFLMNLLPTLDRWKTAGAPLAEPVRQQNANAGAP